MRDMQLLPRLPGAHPCYYQSKWQPEDVARPPVGVQSHPDALC